jgi:hypothetical protein
MAPQGDRRVSGIRHLTAGLLLAALAGAAPAADSLFTDPQDGWLDATKWLRGRYGFMPVPTIITEPAIGYGAGLGLMFLHEPIGGTKDKPASGPPSISGVMAAATENGTWGVGGGHFGSWFNDSVRYVGGAGYGHVDVDYWIGDRAVEYTMDVFGLVQRLQVRIPETPVFVGVRYVFMDTEIGGDVLDRLPDEARRMRTGGLGGSLSFDTLDNLLTPTRGVDLNYVGIAYAPAFGGEEVYQRYEARQRVHVPIVPAFGVGLRLDGQYATSGTPFWHQPYVDLRGVAAARYQDNVVLVAETELRWNVWERFWLIGFGGAGAAEPEAHDIPSGSWHPAGGGGFRYVIARGFGLLRRLAGGARCGSVPHRAGRPLAGGHHPGDRSGADRCGVAGKTARPLGALTRRPYLSGASLPSFAAFHQCHNTP